MKRLLYPGRTIAVVIAMVALVLGPPALAQTMERLQRQADVGDWGASQELALQRPLLEETGGAGAGRGLKAEGCRALSKVRVGCACRSTCMACRPYPQSSSPPHH